MTSFTRLEIFAFVCENFDQKKYNVRMKIYLVHNISGFYLGRFNTPIWTDRMPTITPTMRPDVMFREMDVLDAYWNYLWRLGEYTWGMQWVIPAKPGRVGIRLEEFAKYFLFQLWPEWGRVWNAVGATVGALDSKRVMWRVKMFEPAEVSRVIWPYDIILRYRERLWWGKSVFMAAEGKWVYEQGPFIGSVLMFDLRGTGVAKKNEDEWDFGLTWWEGYMTDWGRDWYLWSSANVRYLGLGVRKSATLLSLQHEK